jgi:hypothetical protein
MLENFILALFVAKISNTDKAFTDTQRNFIPVWFKLVVDYSQVSSCAIAVVGKKCLTACLLVL